MTAFQTALDALVRQIEREERRRCAADVCPYCAGSTVYDAMPLAPNQTFRASWMHYASGRSDAVLCKAGAIWERDRTAE